MAPLQLLQGDDFLKLARIFCNQENVAVNNIILKSEFEQADHLRSVKDNYNTTIKFLVDVEALEEKYKDKETKSSIAHETFSYVEKAINMSFQSCRNYTLQTSYLSKIVAHSIDIFEALETLDLKNVTNVAPLAKEAKQYNECIEQFMLNHQSPASRNFSKWLKDSGATFDKLVIK